MWMQFLWLQTVQISRLFSLLIIIQLAFDHPIML